MAVDGRKWIKPQSVVAHLQNQSAAINPNGNFDVGAIRVADDVVDRFLENQKHLTPRLRSDANLVVAFQGTEFQKNVSRHERLVGKLAHALRQEVKVVLSWIDGPHDVTHGIHKLARDHSDSEKGRVDFGIALADATADHFAQDGHLREAGANVVVEIGGDAGANALHGQQLRQAA